MARIATRLDFDSLATPEREVKFLVRTDAGALPGSLAALECVFQPSVSYPFHIQFLRAFPELSSYSSTAYAADTQSRASRRFAPGSLYWFPAAAHPDGTVGVMAYTISVSSTVAPDSPDGWAELDRRLGASVGIPGSALVLVGGCGCP